MTQRANELTRKLDDGEVVFGANSSAASPTVVEAMGQTDLDFVWVDLEHAGPSPFDSLTLQEFVRAAELAGIELLVRVPEARPKMIGKVLDAGVKTVLVPQVRTAEEVERAVSAAYFDYEGEPGGRGAPLAWCSGWHPPSRPFLDAADDEVCIGVMIETREAVENVDDILSVPELGFVFVGFSDLSIDAGHPMDGAHEEVRALETRIREAAAREDVPIGRIASTPEGAAAAIEDGYRIVQIGLDLQYVREAIAHRLKAIAERR